MGANFALSVVCLFMSQWENETVYANMPIELVVFKRYIDDIFILWKGEQSSLVYFPENLNKNDRNIKLSWDISEKTVSFLDLEIIQEDNSLCTKANFQKC